jgi:hypothetical protein
MSCIPIPFYQTGTPYIRRMVWTVQVRHSRRYMCACALRVAVFTCLKAHGGPGAFGATPGRGRRAGGRRGADVSVRVLGRVDVVKLVRILRAVVERDLLACGDVTHGQPVDIEPPSGEDDASRGGRGARFARVVEVAPLGALSRSHAAEGVVVVTAKKHRLCRRPKAVLALDPPPIGDAASRGNGRPRCSPDPAWNGQLRLGLALCDPTHTMD